MIDDVKVLEDYHFLSLDIISLYINIPNELPHLCYLFMTYEKVNRCVSIHEYFKKGFLQTIQFPSIYIALHLNISLDKCTMKSLYIILSFN